MPNYFENIVGQDYACKLLSSQIEAGNTSHAYLFVGPAGCGKLNCAKALAKALQGPGFVDQIDNDSMVDVKIYEPEGVQTYLVGQITNIVKDSVLAPIQGQYKIYILKEADKLGTSAANAFLKTLEEPTQNVCFILLTNNAKNVLETINSRCQLVEFKQLPNDLAVETVMKASGCDSNHSQMAVELFGGNTTKAIEFCQDQNMEDLYSEIISTAESLDEDSDWDTIQRSNDIINKIKEMVDVYKTELEEKTKDLSEVLEDSAISIIEDQNKRSANSKQKELLHFFCAVLNKHYRDQLLESSNQESLISRLSCLSDFEQNLAYNISPQNFCDVVLLKLKRI